MRNAGLGSIALLLNRLANMVLLVLISRQLGAGATGIYSIAISYYLIGSRFAAWGLDHVLTRDVARNYADAERYFANFLTIRIVNGLIMTGLLVAIAYSLPYDAQTAWVIVLMALAIVPENVATLGSALFIAFERTEYSSAAMGLTAAIKISAVWWVLQSGGTVAAVAIVVVISALANALIHLFFVGRSFVPLRLQFDRDFLRLQLQVATPFILVGIFFILDNRMDNIVLSLLLDETAVGYYSAALAVVTALTMIPQGIRSAIYPILARIQANQPEVLSTAYRHIHKYLMIVALPIVAGIVMISSDLITWLFTDAFLPSAAVLRLLVLTFLAFSINVLNSRVLVVHDQQALMARFLLISLLVNLTALLIAVPLWGIQGAALAKVLSALVLAFLTQRAVRFTAPPAALASLWTRPLLAVCCMSVVVWAGRGYGMVWQIVVGAAVYLFVLMITRTFPATERALWGRAVGLR